MNRISNFILISLMFVSVFAFADDSNFVGTNSVGISATFDSSPDFEMQSDIHVPIVYGNNGSFFFQGQYGYDGSQIGLFDLGLGGRFFTGPVAFGLNGFYSGTVTESGNYVDVLSGGLELMGSFFYLGVNGYYPLHGEADANGNEVLYGGIVDNQFKLYQRDTDTIETALPGVGTNLGFDFNLGRGWNLDLRGSYDYYFGGNDYSDYSFLMLGGGVEKRWTVNDNAAVSLHLNGGWTLNAEDGNGQSNWFVTPMIRVAFGGAKKNLSANSDILFDNVRRHSAPVVASRTVRDDEVDAYDATVTINGTEFSGVTDVLNEGDDAQATLDELGAGLFFFNGFHDVGNGLYMTDGQFLVGGGSGLTFEAAGFSVGYEVEGIRPTLSGIASHTLVLSSNSGVIGFDVTTPDSTIWTAQGVYETGAVIAYNIDNFYLEDITASGRRGFVFDGATNGIGKDLSVLSADVNAVRFDDGSSNIFIDGLTTETSGWSFGFNNVNNITIENASSGTPDVSNAYVNNSSDISISGDAEEFVNFSSYNSTFDMSFTLPADSFVYIPGFMIVESEGGEGVSVAYVNFGEFEVAVFADGSMYGVTGGERDLTSVTGFTGGEVVNLSEIQEATMVDIELINAEVVNFNLRPSSI